MKRMYMCLIFLMVIVMFLSGCGSVDVKNSEDSASKQDDNSRWVVVYTVGTVARAVVLHVRPGPYGSNGCIYLERDRDALPEQNGEGSICGSFITERTTAENVDRVLKKYHVQLIDNDY